MSTDINSSKILDMNISKILDNKSHNDIMKMNQSIIKLMINILLIHELFMVRVD